MKRRHFVKTISATGLGLAAARSPLLAFRGAPSEKVVVAIMGLNGRGTVLGRVFAKTPNATVAYVCDVDSQVLAKGAAAVGEAQTPTPKALADFRRALDDKAVDALVVAAPDHWHAPAAILALSAGKHVYLEKPCGHNAREGELLVDAQRKTKRVVQMGTQRRSSPRAQEAVQAIREGAIGRPYLARAWYANRRRSIGRGKVAPVPTGLDYELWQGLSCNPFPTQNRSRGTIAYGTAGTVVLDQDGYTVYDLENKVVKESIAQASADPLAPSGDDQLTALHIANFVEAVRTGAPVTQPIAEGAKSVLLCHPGNISQWTGRALRIDPQSGHVQGDEQAMGYWQREYAPGWTPVV